jgi:PPM family protein phosphatase
MEYFAASDIGNYREKNEDYYYCGKNLFVVADGMGGHNAGEVASKVAVENFTEYFSKNLEKLIQIDQPQIQQILKSSISHANNKVYRLSIEKPEYFGMGTTLTACYINNLTAYAIHIGDSRLYVKNEKKLNLLTSDHTVVGEMFRSGLISYDETFNHPKKNFLTNVLGLSNEINADFFTINLDLGDILILCSDGLNSMLKDDFIFKIINKFKNTKQITEKLIYGAKAKGGFDNITIITIKI